jgi:hypothetical protein
MYEHTNLHEVKDMYICTNPHKAKGNGKRGKNETLN